MGTPETWATRFPPPWHCPAMIKWLVQPYLHLVVRACVFVCVCASLCALSIEKGKRERKRKLEVKVKWSKVARRGSTSHPHWSQVGPNLCLITFVNYKKRDWTIQSHNIEYRANKIAYIHGPTRFYGAFQLKMTTSITLKFEFLNSYRNPVLFSLRLKR